MFINCKFQWIDPIRILMTKLLKFNREFTYVRNNNLYIPFMSFSTPFRNSSIWANVTADPILIELAS